MKKYTYILAAALTFVACAKEENKIDEPIVEPSTNIEVEEPAQEVHELFVSIEDIVDADTKAAISVLDGSFTWTTGDHIAVKTSTNDVYDFTATADGAAVRFTYTGSMNGTPVEVKYPYTADFSDTAIPTALASLTGALGASAIRLAGTITDNSVTLTHQHAFMKVSFTNVPMFANAVVFDGNVNDVTVSGISLGSRGEVTAYIPVDASTTSYTVYVKDDNDNTILSKSTTKAKTFTAGTIKNMKPVDVDGHVFVFNDNNKVNKARFFATDGTTIDYGTNSYITLNVLSDGNTKWCILPTSNSWTETGDPVCLQVFKGDDYVSATDAIWLYRDFVFDTTEGSLKTEYRIYPTSSTHSSLNMYLTKPLSLYIKNTANWGNVNVYLWGFKGATKVEPWGDYDARKSTWIGASGSDEIGAYSGLARYDLNYELLGSDSASSGLIIGNLSTADKSGDLNTSFTGDIVVDFTVGTSSIATTYYNNRVSVEWPGTAYTGISSSAISTKYYGFAGDTYYGQTLWGVYSVAGASQSASWSIVVNRDYVKNY